MTSPSTCPACCELELSPVSGDEGQCLRWGAADWAGCGSGLLGLLFPNLGSQALPGTVSRVYFLGQLGCKIILGAEPRSDHADFSLLFLSFPASTLTSFFFLMWSILKSVESVILLLLFYVLCFWPRAMWNLSFPTRDRTHVPCIGRSSLNHWTTREVPLSSLLHWVSQALFC